MRKQPRIYLSISLFLISIFVQFLHAQDQKVKDNIVRAETFEAAGSLDKAADVYVETGKLLQNTGRADEAVVYYEKSLKIHTELGNRSQKTKLHEILSAIYFEAENYSSAILHLEQLKNYKSRSSKLIRVGILINLATAQYEVQDLSGAIAHIEEAFSFAQEIPDEVGIQLKKEKQRECAILATQCYKKKGDQSSIDKWEGISKALEIEIERLLEAEVSSAKTETHVTKVELAKTKTDLEEEKELTREQQMALELKDAQLKIRDARISEEKAKREAQAQKEKNLKQRLLYSIIGLISLLVFVILLAAMFLRLKSANKQINQQRLSLEKQNKEIRASIRYAQTIQQAMLPSDEQINEYFDPFIIYRPKDIVSGDFYWIHSQKEKGITTVYLAVVDCTGHGVPGAFMSMIGNRLLNDIVVERKIESPAEILKMLNTMVREALRQEETDNNDGMDLAFCKFEISGKGKSKLIFAGAKRPVYIINNKENKLLSHNGDRKSIGGYSLSRREVNLLISNMIWRRET